MSNSIAGGQLKTYNSNLPYTTSGTAGTSGVIVYGQVQAGFQGGITNTITNAENTGASTASLYYMGCTHFNNIAGNNGVYMGPAGSEIPLIDKQESILAVCTVSAATVYWGVTPFQCTMTGYWTQDGAAVGAATANMVAIYSGSSASGGLLATIANPTGGGPGDTYTWACATPATVIAGGQPISFNFNTTVVGTAYGQYVTAVLTRVGI